MIETYLSPEDARLFSRTLTTTKNLRHAAEHIDEAIHKSLTILFTQTYPEHPIKELLKKIREEEVESITNAEHYAVAEEMLDLWVAWKSEYLLRALPSMELPTEETIILTFFFQIASPLHQYFHAWNTHLYPEDVRTKETAKHAMEEALKDTPAFFFPHNAIKKVGETYTVVPYFQIPELKEKIQGLLPCFTLTIQALPAGHPFQNFLQAWQQALLSEDLEATEEYWKEAILAWLAYTGTIQCGLPEEESYKDGVLGLRQSPELLVGYPDEDYEALREEGKELLTTLHSYYAKKYAHHGETQKSLESFQKTQVYVISTIIKSGQAAYSGAAAQIQPNDGKIRMEHGAKIMLFEKDALRTALREYLPIYTILEHRRGNPTPTQEQLKILIAGKALTTIGHEACHALFSTQYVQDTLGTYYKDVEEAKATYAFLMEVRALKAEGHLHTYTLENLAEGIFLRMIRLLSMTTYTKEHPVYPYFIEIVSLAHRMCQRAAVHPTTFALDAEKCFLAIEDIGETLRDLYQEPSAQKAKAFLEDPINTTIPPLFAEIIVFVKKEREKLSPEQR